MEHPGFINKFGVSPILLRTRKGERQFEKCVDIFEIKETTVSKILHENLSLIYSNGNIEIQKEFFRYYRDSKEDLGKACFLLEQSEMLQHVGILGSYSSRTSIQRLKLLCPDININWQITNSTIYSMTSKAVTSIDDSDINCSNNYRRESVLCDIKKDLQNKIVNSQANQWMLIDFLEERYPIYIFEDGSALTDSEAFLETNIEPMATKVSCLEIPIDEWEKHCLKLIDILKQFYRPEQVILNCLYLTEYFGQEGPEEIFSEKADIQKINKRLEYYYRFFRANFDGIQVIEVKDSAIDYCSAAFPYGCEPYYYNTERYHQTSLRLSEVIRKNANK